MKLPIAHKERKYRTYYDDEANPPKKKEWRIDPITGYTPDSSLSELETKWVRDGEIFFLPEYPVLKRVGIPFTDGVFIYQGGEDRSHQFISMLLPVPEILSWYGFPVLLRFSIEVASNEPLLETADNGFEINVRDLFLGAVVLPATRLFSTTYIRRYLVWIAGVVVAKAPNTNIAVKFNPIWRRFPTKGNVADYNWSSETIPLLVSPTHSVQCHDPESEILNLHLEDLCAGEARSQFRARFSTEGEFELLEAF